MDNDMDIAIYLIVVGGKRSRRRDLRDDLSGQDKDRYAAMKEAFRAVSKADTKLKMVRFEYQTDTGTLCYEVEAVPVLKATVSVKLLEEALVYVGDPTWNSGRDRLRADLALAVNQAKEREE